MLLLGFAPMVFAQQANATEHGQPALRQRPAPKLGALKGAILLDVLVMDAGGKPVGGLTQQDFALLDNGQPRPLLSFEALNGPTHVEPPVEVILVLDEVNNLLRNIAFERDGIERLLRQNGGRLAHPTTLMIFTERGVQTEPQPLTDGNALADHLAKSPLATHMIPLAGGYDAIQRLQQSLRAINLIATAEANKPGRKLLVWIGPGWPMLERAGYEQSDRSQQAGFNSLVEITQRLEEARITMYSVNPLSGGMLLASRHKDFLKPVTSPQNFQAGALGTPIFATHSGGLVLNIAADLVDLLNRCVAEAQPSYVLGFDPPAVGHADEYHALTVTVNKPGLTVRTRAGYYAEPALAP